MKGLRLLPIFNAKFIFTLIYLLLVLRMPKLLLKMRLVLKMNKHVGVKKKFYFANKATNRAKLSQLGHQTLHHNF